MKLTDEQKTGKLMRMLKEINDLSFEGSERPFESMFDYHFQNYDVFSTGSSYPEAFAIVNRLDGKPHIWTLAVHPEVRGLGLGTLILREINKAYEEVTLSTRVDNIPAQVLYLKNGYRVERVMRGYYPNKIDGLFMRRKDYGKN